MQDPLTGLRSGRMLDGDVDLLSRSGPVALLLVDLDDFRRFNELGYREGGDRALVSATQRMMASLRRRADRVYRLHTAGDEFAALMSIRDERQALITAQRLCVALRDNGTPASIGVAYCDGSTDPRACELLADASANKEKAKEGRKESGLSVSLRRRSATATATAADCRRSRAGRVSSTAHADERGSLNATPRRMLLS